MLDGSVGRSSELTRPPEELARPGQAAIADHRARGASPGEASAGGTLNGRVVAGERQREGLLAPASARGGGTP